eukprot:1598399-Rhodomonas_salina.5
MRGMHRLDHRPGRVQRRGEGGSARFTTARAPIASALALLALTLMRKSGSLAAANNSNAGPQHDLEARDLGLFEAGVALKARDLGLFHEAPALSWG